MPQTDRPAEDIRRELAELREELRGMAAEVEREALESSLDVRDRWNRLQPRLEDFEERSRRPSEANAAILRKRALHLRSRLEKLRTECRR